MNNMMKLLLIAIFGIAILCVGSVKKADAMAIRFADGVNPDVLVYDDAAGDLLPGALGQMLVIGSIGDWVVATGTGLSRPLTGPSNFPAMDLIVSATTIGGSLTTLTVELSDIGWDALAPGVPGFSSAIGGTFMPHGGAAVGTVTFDTFFDPDNIHFGNASSNEVSLASLSYPGLVGPITPFGGPVVNTLASPLSTYSLNILTTITHTGAATTSYNASLVANPEPGTIALLGIGLAGLVGVGVRRKMKKKED